MLRAALLVVAVAGGLGLLFTVKRGRKKSLTDRLRSSVSEGLEAAGRSRKRGEQALRQRIEDIRPGKMLAAAKSRRAVPLLVVVGTAACAGTTYALRGRIAGILRNGNAGARNGNHHSSTTNSLRQRVSRVLSSNSSSLNDADLARKVRDEIFQGREALAPQVAVSSEHAVVVLRGEVDDPELITELAQAARSIEGVQDVENLLHSKLERSPEPVLVGGKSKKS